MTSVDRLQAGPYSGANEDESVIVLHVVESWGAGVRAAVLQFANATPGVEHHLIRGTGRREFSTDGDSVFASIRELPRGIAAAGRAIRDASVATNSHVVHAHSSFAGVFTRLTIRSTAARRVLYSPHCFAFERRDLGLLGRAVARAIEWVLAVNTDTLVACSPGEAAAAKRLGHRRVVYVPNVASVATTATGDGPQRVVAVGRLGAQKDPDFFRETVRLLRARRPATSAQWIGDGDTGARSRLEADDIRVSGWIPTAAVHHGIAAAGVYLHTARWEGFPIAILEAVELGVPVLAREVPTLAGASATPGILTPQQLADAAALLLDGGGPARRRNLAAWRRTLAANTTEQQATALGLAYRAASRPILINGKWLGAPQSGMQRYAGEVARRLLVADPTARVAVPRGARLPRWLPADRVVRARLSGVPFEQLELPWLGRGATLVNLAGAAPMLTREQLVVMHDATPARFPRTFSRRFVAWYRFMYSVLAGRARHLVTVSEFSRRELAEVLGVDALRIAVATNGHEHATAEPGFVPSAELRTHTAEPYVLFVGNLTPSKNLLPVAAAFAAAGIPVIIVGAAHTARVYVREAGLDIPGVWLAGRMSDAELAWLLNGARALVFPSLYEGFGLPIVEAQALGCPVIASDRASIPEVAGAGALYFDPLQPLQAVDLLLGLDSATRRRLVARGHENVDRFRWDDTASTILALVRDAKVVAR
jgi:glycosyltransferase involved in cell wall biosynthesis